ncbi:SNF1-interacting protein [Batrachochytrium dendrobatidis]
MREFLQLQFNVTISDAHIPHMLTPSIPDTLTHTLHNMEFGQTHTTLLYWKSIIADIRKEVEILVCMLDDMEKHLVWALYFNWVQDVILSRCGNNQTVGSTNANQICCLQVVEIEAV